MFVGRGGGVVFVDTCKWGFLDGDPRSCVPRRLIIKTSFFYKLDSSLIPWCDDKLLLSKLLFLHGIYYNVIRQDPNHDTLF